MKEHFHNVYVVETINEVVKALQLQGIRVDYKPDPEDPEDSNGFIEHNSGIVSSCVRWRAHSDPLFAEKVPEKAMACLQIVSSAANFAVLRSAIEGSFTVVKNCSIC